MAATRRTRKAATNGTGDGNAADEYELLGSTDEVEAAKEVPDIRTFTIPRPKEKSALIHLQGTSPLVMGRWSEKAIRMLENSQTGKPKEQREAKDPYQDAVDCAYILPGKEDALNEPGKFYFPAAAFKHAFLYGVTQLGDTKKFPRTQATGWVFVNFDPVLGFEGYEIRTDIGRNPVQMLYRFAFHGWSVELDVTYNSNKITLEQVASIFDLGGVGGVGEMRPSAPNNKAGSFGRFKLAEVTSLPKA